MVAQLVIQGFAMGAVYALVAVGFALIFGTTKTFHFAHGATYAMSAYGFVGIATITHNVILGILGALLVAAIFGVGLDRWIYQPMRRKTAASFLTIFVASMGALYVVENAIGLIAGSTPFIRSSGITVAHKIFGLSLPPIDGVAVGTALIIFVGLTRFLNRTTIGYGLRALGDDPELVSVVGASLSRLYLWAFAIGSALVVPAAVLAVYITGGQPNMGDSIIDVAVAATIVGGVGSLPGAAVGALVLGMAQTLTLAVLPSIWQNAVGFGLLFLVIVLRPQGIMAPLNFRKA